MSDKKSEVEGNDLLEIDPSPLKVNSTLPFDCFVQRKFTAKALHWIRAGAVYTTDHQIKLEKFKNDSKILIFKFQYDQYLLYTGQAKEDTKPLEPRSSIAPLDEVGEAISKTSKSDSSEVKALGKIEVKQDALSAGTVEQVHTPPVVAQANPAPRMKVDASFLNVIISSTQKALHESYGVRTQLHAPVKRPAAQKIPFQVDVASFISVASQTIRGTISLCFPLATYKSLFPVPPDMPQSEITYDYFAGSAELIHSIYSTSLPELRKQGYYVDLAVPFYVVSRNIPIHAIVPEPGFSILFDSDKGPFKFEIGIKAGA